MAAPPNTPPTNVPPANPPPANPPPVLALVPMPPAPQNQVKNGFHTKTWGDGSKCVAQPARRLPPACMPRACLRAPARASVRWRVQEQPRDSSPLPGATARRGATAGTKASGLTTK